MSECSEEYISSWADTHQSPKEMPKSHQRLPFLGGKGAIPGCLGWISSTSCPLATCTLLQVWLRGLEEHKLPPSNPTVALHQLLQCQNFSLSRLSSINFLALLAAWEEPLTACLIACLLLPGRAELSSEGTAPAVPQLRREHHAERREKPHRTVPHPRKGGAGLAGSNSRFASRQGSAWRVFPPAHCKAKLFPPCLHVSTAAKRAATAPVPRAKDRGANWLLLESSVAEHL